MSVLVEPGVVERVCAGCGVSFVEPRRGGAPRTYCFTCSPRKNAGVQVLEPRVKGKPFTVAHFRAWAGRKKLKDSSFFKLEPYQAVFLEDLFARDAEGLPVFAELWLVLPEGNGKTTFVALIVLYVIEFKAEAWVPVAASARDQAVDLTYRICSGFVERNRLDGSFKLHPGYRQVIHKRSLGALKIFASDAASGDGVDPDLAVIEELHRLATMDLYETWAGKLDKSQGQLVIASTAGAAGSAFEKLRAHIRVSATESHRDGCFLRAVAPGLVLHEYAIPEDGDPEDLELVAAANPFSGKTVAALAKKRAKPSWNLAHWTRFTCNLPTREANSAITEREWHDAATAEKAPPGAEWWAGLDVGWRWDTTAFVPLWWRDDKYRLLAPAVIVEPPRDRSSTDPDDIKRAFLELRKTYAVSTVVMDTSRAEDIAGWLSNDLGLTVVDHAQTNKPQCEDYERFMEALRQGWLRHSGDEGLRRHAFNTTVKLLPDGSARFDKPSKIRRGGDDDARVNDALIAAAMVHSVRCEPSSPVHESAGFS